MSNLWLNNQARLLTLWHWDASPKDFLKCIYSFIHSFRTLLFPNNICVLSNIFIYSLSNCRFMWSTVILVIHIMFRCLIITKESSQFWFWFLWIKLKSPDAYFGYMRNSEHLKDHLWVFWSAKGHSRCAAGENSSPVKLRRQERNPEVTFIQRPRSHSGESLQFWYQPRLGKIKKNSCLDTRNRFLLLKGNNNKEKTFYTKSDIRVKVNSIEW